MANLWLLSVGTKKMPETHALSKFLYVFYILPTPVSPPGERHREGVFPGSTNADWAKLLLAAL